MLRFPRPPVQAGNANVEQGKSKDKATSAAEAARFPAPSWQEREGRWARA